MAHLGLRGVQAQGWEIGKVWVARLLLFRQPHSYRASGGGPRKMLFTSLKFSENSHSK